MPRVPTALRLGPNIFFETLDLYWTSPESGATVVQIKRLEKDALVAEQVGSVPWEIILHVVYVITLGCVPPHGGLRGFRCLNF